MDSVDTKPGLRSDAQVEQTRSELEALSAEQRGLRTESDMSFAKALRMKQT